MQGRLRFTPGIATMLTPAEPADWDAKLAGAWGESMLNPAYRAIEPVMGERALSGAAASRAGNPCFRIAPNMISMPQGSNGIVDGGLNIGGGGGGTQF